MLGALLSDAYVHLHVISEFMRIATIPALLAICSETRTDLLACYELRGRWGVNMFLQDSDVENTHILNILRFLKTLWLLKDIWRVFSSLKLRL